MKGGIERWEYEDEDDVFEFGREVTADVQRRETHNCIGGASRSACRFGREAELTTRSTTPPLSPITGSSIEQRGCKKVHWKERRLNTLAHSSRLARYECFEFGTEGDIGCVHLFGRLRSESTAKTVAAIFKSFIAG